MNITDITTNEVRATLTELVAEAEELDAPWAEIKPSDRTVRIKLLRNATFGDVNALQKFGGHLISN